MTDQKENKNSEDQKDTEDTLALIKPDAFYRSSEIIERLLSEGFTLLEKKQLRLTKQKAGAFYAEHKARPFFAELVSFMTSGTIYALKLRAPNAIKKWRALMGPTKYELAVKEAPNSLRALFGTNTTKNACHGSDSPQSAKRELDFYFDTEQTLALIKPDAVANGHADKIIEMIQQDGFLIIEQQQLTLTKEKAEQFYQEHKGKGFFGELISFITSGPIFALKLERNNGIAAWRTLMGPTKRGVALQSAPNSIRALYGTDTTQNAAHGSDSITSAARELSFFFKREQTLAMLKPDVVKNKKTVADIIERITGAEQFRILSSRQLQLSQQQAEAFYGEHKGKGFFGELVGFMTSGPIYALKLERSDAIKHWRRVMGPTKHEVAKQEAPNSMRALYGSNTTQNATHGSDSVESAARELEFFFEARQNVGAADQQLTLALIKPMACSKKRDAAIIERILYEGFEIVEMKRMKMSEQLAKQFYAEHDGKSFFGELVQVMTSGELVAMKLQRNNAIKQWRKVMGPTRPEQAVKEAPNSIRALYASDMTNNGSHGSDSVQSAKRELDLFFPN